MKLIEAKLLEKITGGSGDRNGDGPKLERTSGTTYAPPKKQGTS
ncbi:hypothetical protein [Pseudoalteromonas sp. DY56-GL79]